MKTLLIVLLLCFGLHAEEIGVPSIEKNVGSQHKVNSSEIGVAYIERKRNKAGRSSEYIDSAVLSPDGKSFYT